MKWLKRCLWLAAWSVWLWLGFGLYLGLPRNQGTAIGRIPLKTNEYVRGFLGNTHNVIIEEPTPSGGRGWFDVYDIHSGDRRALTECEKQRNRGPWKGPLAYLPQFSSPRRREYNFRTGQLLPFEQVKLPSHWSTVEVVDDATGRVVWREWKGDPWWTRYESADERLTVLANGTIVRSPPPPNWPLLIVVQVLLALPLPLVWAILQWQQKASPARQRREPRSACFERSIICTPLWAGDRVQ
jgi:hypothetical protein